MEAEKSRSIRWRAIALGWLVAVTVGVLITPALRFLYDLIVELSAERGEPTSAAAAIAVLAGFVAYLFGGYVAARLSDGYGGLNGAMTAVFGVIVGLVVAVILSAFGLVFAEGVALPPSTFGLAAGALAIGSVLFVVNLFGGYVGGKLGEPAGPASGPSETRSRNREAN